MTEKRFYKLILGGVIIGVTYLLIQLYIYKPKESICLFKTVTSIPCPSCGSTRSVLELLNGNFFIALHWNPLGIFTFALMVVIPPWALYDKIFNRVTLYLTYKKMEEKLNKLYISIPLIILVIANWIWNIYKGL